METSAFEVLVPVRLVKWQWFALECIAMPRVVITGAVMLGAVMGYMPKAVITGADMGGAATVLHRTKCYTFFVQLLSRSVLTSKHCYARLSWPVTASQHDTQGKFLPHPH